MEHLTRQADLIPSSALTKQINIIGAGAVGSWLTLALAKMGFSNLTVFDDDDIEVENMNCQCYSFNDIGKKKVTALKERVHELTGTNINAVVSRYEGDRAMAGIVVSAVDSMASRRQAWEIHAKYGTQTNLFIDPRMGAEEALCYAYQPMKPDHVKQYEATLYSDDDAVHEPCTRKATMYTALMLSGLVAQIIKEFLTNKGNHLQVSNWSIKNGAFVGFTEEKVLSLSKERTQ